MLDKLPEMARGDTQVSQWLIYNTRVEKSRNLVADPRFVAHASG